MRKPIIAGNWKMHKTIAESLELVKCLKDGTTLDVEAVVCVPFTALSEVAKSIEGTELKLGAQNMHWEENGAFTGEISPLMLSEIGVDYVIIGHSERREYFNESDETVNKKIISALSHGITPILCVGESLEEREAGAEKIKVKTQLVKGLEGIKASDIENIVVAYEPIWAIGTGKTATSEQANEIISFIRTVIRDIAGDAGDSVRIQYGGSVKSGNIGDIMNQSDIDGALVGGASLEPEEFLKLINYGEVK